ALLEAAKEFKENGSVSLRHYMISHTVGTERIKEMVQQGYNLTARNFKSSDAFFDTCLFYLLLEDSFGKDLSEFSKKTAALTEDQRAIFVEERLQMLTFLATKAKNADPEAPFAAYALYSIKGALLKNREVFHCYDLLCRTALNESYPISYVSTATDPISKERWEITKRCYDAYTAGTLSAKETLALLVRERQNIKDHVDPYGFLKYEPYC
ncbi:MAG: hypothetical protein IJY89_04465, partial [Clostridia bacterium]|nr:hypothetical protein [Clostridia bacterium]